MTAPRRLLLVALIVLSSGELFAAQASGTFTVGSFTKSTSGAPIAQAVAHGLGVTPKAIILWTNGKTGTTVSAGFLYGFGMADGTTSLSTATTSDALRGITSSAGCFNKSTSGAPASQAVTGLGFRPNLVLLTSNQNTASTVGVAQGRFGLGASDGTTEGSSAWQDTDVLDTTSTDGVDKTSKVFIKVNNDTQAIDAEADLSSFDADGFTVNWTTNDAVATEICYLALSVRRTVVIGAAAPARPGDATPHIL